MYADKKYPVNKNRIFFFVLFQPAEILQTGIHIFFKGTKINSMCFQLLSIQTIIPEAICIPLMIRKDAGIDLFLCDSKTQLLFALRQGNPQPSPCTEFLVIGENALHLFTGIALSQRAYVSVVHLKTSFLCIRLLFNYLIPSLLYTS